MITIIKRDHQGRDVLSYQGEMITRDAHSICIQARFGFPDKNYGYVTLRKGDLFTEWFYDNRWYNIFQVEDVATGQLKGWYCNITRPAIITEDTIAADDLELDVFVNPHGQTLILDQEAFDALDLEPAERVACANAVDTLHKLVKRCESPFDRIQTP